MVGGGATVIEYVYACEPLIGQALSCTRTVNTFNPTLASVGVQQKVPTGCGVPVTTNVADGIPLFQVIVTVSFGSGSAELIVKQV
jgi:hypothetical protein